MYIENYLSEINFENKILDKEKEIIEIFFILKECVEVVYNMK